MKWESINTKPKRQELCLLKMQTPSGGVDYVTGWYNGAPECYEWECNMEDTHHGGYLEAPYTVIEWALLESIESQPIKSDDETEPHKASWRPPPK